MNTVAKIQRLQKLSELILDTHLGKFRACVAARNASIQGLQDLTVKAVADADPILFAQSQVRYEAWADARRGEINMLLARQTAEWLEEKKAAKLAFGRAKTIRQLQKM